MSFKVEVSFEVTTCCKCGGPIALEAGVWKELHNTHDTFSCPMGHVQHFTGKTCEEKLAESVAAHNRLAEQLATMKMERDRANAVMRVLDQKLEQIRKKKRGNPR